MTSPTRNTPWTEISAAYALIRETLLIGEPSLNPDRCCQTIAEREHVNKRTVIRYLGAYDAIMRLAILDPQLAAAYRTGPRERAIGLASYLSRPDETFLESAKVIAGKANIAMAPAVPALLPQTTPLDPTPSPTLDLGAAPRPDAPLVKPPNPVTRYARRADTDKLARQFEDMFDATVDKVIALAAQTYGLDTDAAVAMRVDPLTFELVKFAKQALKTAQTIHCNVSQENPL